LALAASERAADQTGMLHRTTKALDAIVGGHEKTAGLGQKIGVLMILLCCR
jgi:hypothetical protein